ncbi:MAG: HYC_CC_PP family protein [Bacteroidota bacterium]
MNTHKIVSFISAIVFLIITSGIGISIHTCHDTITDFSIFPVESSHAEHSSCSANCSTESTTHEEDHSECCANERIIFQYTEELFTSQPQQISHSIQVITGIISLLFDTDFFTESKIHSPPVADKKLYSLPKLYSLLCSYVLYE